MSLPKYRKYKDSTFDWLGQIPAHWAVGPLKRWFDVSLGKMLQVAAASETDCLRSYLRAANIKWGGVDTADVKTMWFSPRDIAQLRLREGDLLVSEGGDVGRSSLWREELPECYIQNSVNRIRSRGEGLTAFLYYWMVTIKAKGYVDVLCNKSTIAHFTAEKVAEVPTPIPPIGEQIAIAAFLDREAAKIDALIAEQEKLITLLAEKRQATISHAVTCGVRPDATMKDSGVAWMKEVPTHWAVAKLGHFATVENGTTPSRAVDGYWEGGDIPWLASGEVNQLQITEASEFITRSALESCSLRLLPVGTVVVGLIGQGKTRGMSAMLCIPAAINQNLAAICPGQSIDGSYILYVLHAVYEWLREAGRGGNQAAMNCEMLSALRIPVPMVEEQRDIVSFIEIETTKLDALKAEAERAIALLKERRSALIAAAVTGQIDVRGAVALVREEIAA